MKLSIGIIGLPNVGKSTLFKALTKQEVHIANYPFATVDPNVGVVPVPDERLDTLAKLSNSQKVVPAVVEFYDIAGLVKGANKGEGLGNQFLSHIRETNAIAHIVRCFANSDIVHVEGGMNPVRDIDIIETELILKDLETVTKRLEKAESEARSGNKEIIKFRDTLKETQKILENGILIYTLPTEQHSYILQNARISELNLLTTKPQMFLLNGELENVNEDLKLKIKDLGGNFIVSNLALADNMNKLIMKSYEILNLISFFTTGEDETRAWTTVKGAKAPQAAGVIHTDFEKKFIRAEVVSYQDFTASGGWNKAKQKGKMRLEGKDYVVHDGDVVVVRHG